MASNEQQDNFPRTTYDWKNIVQQAKLQSERHTTAPLRGRFRGEYGAVPCDPGPLTFSRPKKALFWTQSRIKRKVSSTGFAKSLRYIS